MLEKNDTPKSPSTVQAPPIGGEIRLSQWSADTVAQVTLHERRVGVLEADDADRRYGLAFEIAGLGQGTFGCDRAGHDDEQENNERGNSPTGRLAAWSVTRVAGSSAALHFQKKLYDTPTDLKSPPSTVRAPSLYATRICRERMGTAIVTPALELLI